MTGIEQRAFDKLQDEQAKLRAINAELLAACERAEVFFRLGELLGQENRAASLLDTINKLRAAIAKANGETP